MAEPLFVSQARLEGGVERGDITFDDNVLVIVAEQRSYEMVPAARVLSLLDGEDETGLIGHVWTIKELEARGAEHFADSLILGDTAYQCEEGFVALPSEDEAESAAVPAQPAAPVAVAVPAPAPEQVAVPASIPAPAPSPVSSPVAIPAASPVQVPAPADAVDSPTSQDDMALLTDFLLKNL